MIPAIGYMVGAFILARMVTLLSREDSANVRAMAILTMLVTIVCLAYIGYLHAAAGEAIGQLYQTGS